MSMPLGFNHVIYSNMLCTIFSLTDINFSLKKKTYQIMNSTLPKRTQMS